MVAMSDAACPRVTASRPSTGSGGSLSLLDHEQLGGDDDDAVGRPRRTRRRGCRAARWSRRARERSAERIGHARGQVGEQLVEVLRQDGNVLLLATQGDDLTVLACLEVEDPASGLARWRRRRRSRGGRSGTVPRTAQDLREGSLVRRGRAGTGRAGRVDRQHDRSTRRVQDGGHRAGRDDDPLEQVERGAERGRRRCLDGVGMGHRDDGLAGVRGAQPGDRLGHAGLHPGERLAVGERNRLGQR